MKHLKKLMHALFFPPAAVVLACALLSSILLVLAFTVFPPEYPLNYASYLFSAYSLTILCLKTAPVFSKLKALLKRNKYIKRFFEDIPYRLNVSLHASLVINLLYAGMHAFSGLYYHSIWSGTLSAYYIFLAVMRYLLVRHIHKNGLGSSLTAELKRYRLVGLILILMNMALAGVVILALRHNYSFNYAGTLIYVMAIYAFYITVMAVINIIRYRQRQSPAMSAARAVNLTAALVSMLAPETAMIAQFNDQSTSPFFREAMIAFTGGAVCTVVVGMGIFMVVHSSKQLKKLGKDNTQFKSKPE